MTQALFQAATRLEVLLTQETTALRSASSPDLADITARKNQSLLELTRLARGIDISAEPASVREALKRLSETVKENQRILALHVRASNEIAAVISRSITDHESDGTYGAHLGRRRPQRGYEAS